MNQPPDRDWQELAKLWQSDVARVSVADIENLHSQLRRRLRAATVAELTVTVLAMAAACWLGLQTRFLWMGMGVFAAAVGSVVVVLHRHRLPAPPVYSDLLESLKGSLTYQDWLAEQLRYGRVASFVALFAVVFAAAVQLMHFATATPSRLLATAAAGTAVVAALVWNVGLAWSVWRRRQRLTGFLQKLVSDHVTDK
jgi:uncharacterized membrane protein YedE/YeeE